MYRRSLEMEENTTTTMSTNTQYNFVNRLFGLPVVRSVIDSATDTYGKTKEGNAFFKYTFGTAEQTVSLAMDYAMPVVGKFETQLVLADSFACKTLDKLEETVPLVKKTPDEIAADAKKMYEAIIVDPASRAYNNVKDYGMQKVTSVKDQGVNQATKLLETEYGAKATVAVERLLSQADSLIDSYLPPPQEGEEQQEASSSSADDSNVLNRALQVSNKFNKRMLAIGTIKVQATKKRVDDILATLNVVDVMNIARSNFEQTNVLLKDQFSQAQLKVLDALQAYKSVPSDLLGKKWSEIFAIEYVTPTLQVLYEKIPSVIPLNDQAHPVISNVSSSVLAIMKPYAEAKSWSDVYDAASAQMTTGVGNLKGLGLYVYDGVRNSKTIVWLVPYLPSVTSQDAGPHQDSPHSQFVLENSGNDKVSSSDEDAVELVVKQH